MAVMAHYRACHSVRQGSRGGGVCIYVNSRINFKPFHNFCVSTDYIECVVFEYQLGRRKFLVGSLYRPPQGRFQAFAEFLEGMLDSVSGAGYDEVILCGDSNVNSRISNGISSQFLDIPTISRPTKISDNYS